MTWLKIKGRSREDIFRILGVVTTGEVGCDDGEGFAGRTFSDGSYLFVASNDEARHLESGLFGAVSADCEVIVCHVHEGRMFSCGAGWQDGHEIWCVQHDNDCGVTYLDVTGQPPAELADIRAALEAKQRHETRGRFRTDYIVDVPVELCAALAGFRHDRMIMPPDPSSFEVLARVT